MSKKNYLVHSTYEHNGILIQSFSVATEKQLDKLSRKVTKHFKKEPILEVRLGAGSDSIISLDELALSEIMDVKFLDKDEAQCISTVLGYEFGALGVDSIYEALEIAKEARKEKVNAE